MSLAVIPYCCFFCTSTYSNIDCHLVHTAKLQPGLLHGWIQMQAAEFSHQQRNLEKNKEDNKYINNFNEKICIETSIRFFFKINLSVLTCEDENCNQEQLHFDIDYTVKSKNIRPIRLSSCCWTLLNCYSQNFWNKKVWRSFSAQPQSPSGHWAATAG